MEFQVGKSLEIAGVQSAMWIQFKSLVEVFTHVQIVCMLLTPVGLIPIIGWNLDSE